MVFLEIGNSTLKVARRQGEQFSILRIAQPLDHDDALRRFLGEEREVVLLPVARELARALLPVLANVPDLIIRSVPGAVLSDFVSQAYDEPERLGLDRILNLMGLEAPGIVVSCGTAVTVDALTVDGPLFGSIGLGFRSAAESLHARVPALPAVSDPASISFPARTTEESVANGVLGGIADGVKGICAKIDDQSEARLPIHVTGGDAEILRALWPDERITVDHELLFRGAEKSLIERS